MAFTANLLNLFKNKATSVTKELNERNKLLNQTIKT